MKYRCECGEINSITWYHFHQGHRCQKCRSHKTASKRRFAYNHVYNYFQEHGCKLLSTKYINVDQLLDYQCNCGEFSKISFKHFKEGHRCVKCMGLRSSEENSSHWDINKSSEDRLKDRKYYSYSCWRKKILERDNYKCQLCGRQEKLEVHHYEDYNFNKDKQTDINNGVTLCTYCHHGFHGKYRKLKPATRKQFEEYIQIFNEHYLNLIKNNQI